MQIRFASIKEYGIYYELEKILNIFIEFFIKLNLVLDINRSGLKKLIRPDLSRNQPTFWQFSLLKLNFPLNRFFNYLFNKEA